MEKGIGRGASGLGGGGPTISAQPPPARPRPARAERQLGKDCRTDGTGRAQHPRRVPTNPYTAPPRGNRSRRAAGAESPRPWTQPRTRPKHALLLAEPPPLCSAAPALPARVPLPASGQPRRSVIKPPTRPAAAIPPLRPLTCPSPYLLPPRPLPPSLAFDSPALPALTPRRPAPGPPTDRQLPADPPQNPSKHAPPLPRPGCLPLREGLCWGRGGTGLRESKLPGASRLRSLSPQHPPPPERVCYGVCVGIPTPALNIAPTRDLDLPLSL